jgi:pimeloyl-ACP methyl ester carboxylesterase
MTLPALVSDWQAQGAIEQVGGHDLFVVDTGSPDAPVLVMLHGFPGSSFDWRHVVAALASRWRIVTLDFLGHGLSAKPDRAYSLFAQADLVEELLAARGVTRASLLAHDMGDTVAAELLVRASVEWMACVLTNGSIFIDMAELTAGQKLLLSLPDEMAAAEAAPTVELLVAALRATCAPDADLPEGELVGLAELIVRDGGNRLLPRTIRYVEERREHEGRWTGAIERHPAPLTIVWGDVDPIAVWPMAERLHTANPDSTLVRLPGIGHYPMLEAPDAFGAALEHAL